MDIIHIFYCIHNLYDVIFILKSLYYEMTNVCINTTNQLVTVTLV